MSKLKVCPLCGGVATVREIHMEDSCKALGRLWIAHCDGGKRDQCTLELLGSSCESVTSDWQRLPRKRRRTA